MPAVNEDNIVPYDLKAWRVQMGAPSEPITKEEAARMLGVSPSGYWRLERAGLVQRYYAWACYGLYMHKQAQGGVA